MVLNMLRIVLLVAGAHELVPVSLMPVVEDFVLGTGRDDADVSNIVASFLSAAR